MYPSVTLSSGIMKCKWSNCAVIISSFTISFHCRNEGLSQQSVNMLEFCLLQFLFIAEMTD
jgi:hypothetical protein